MRLRDWFTIILVGALFGSSFSLIVVTLHELAPLTIAAGRAVVAAITCWAIFLATGHKLPDDPVLIGKLILLGLLTYALPFILMPITQSHLSSSMIAILNLLLPLLTVVVSHYWPSGERATPAKAIGVAVGLAGALLLSAPTLRAGVDGQIWAIGISIGSSVIWAIAFNITRDFRNIPPSAIATVALTGAALFCVPAALLVEGIPTVRYTQTWIAWIVLGVFPTALNFQIMYFMIPRIGTSVTYYGLAVLRQFEAMGVAALNSSNAVAAAGRHGGDLPGTAADRRAHSAPVGRNCTDRRIAAAAQADPSTWRDRQGRQTLRSRLT